MEHNISFASHASSHVGRKRLSASLPGVIIIAHKSCANKHGTRSSDSVLLEGRTKLLEVQERWTRSGVTPAFSVFIISGWHDGRRFFRRDELSISPDFVLGQV
jgi:hypothetical protein